MDLGVYYYYYYLGWVRYGFHPIFWGQSDIVRKIDRFGGAPSEGPLQSIQMDKIVKPQRFIRSGTFDWANATR